MLTVPQQTSPTPNQITHPLTLTVPQQTSPTPNQITHPLTLTVPQQAGQARWNRSGWSGHGRTNL